MGKLDIIWGDLFWRGSKAASKCLWYCLLANRFCHYCSAVTAFKVQIAFDLLKNCATSLCILEKSIWNTAFLLSSLTGFSTYLQRAQGRAGGLATEDLQKSKLVLKFDRLQILSKEKAAVAQPCHSKSTCVGGLFLLLSALSCSAAVWVSLGRFLVYVGTRVWQSVGETTTQRKLWFLDIYTRSKVKGSHKKK